MIKEGLFGHGGDLLVPAIALKTFNELKGQAKYLSLVQLILKRLNKFSHAADRAKFIHTLVDEVNKPVFSNPLVQQLSPCKKGCTACCHTQVSVTEDEAKLLALRINEGTVSVDLEHLKQQMQTRNNSYEFLAIPYKQRKCAFLNEEGGCKVYSDRPSVCRTNSVLGPADQCDTRNGLKPQRLVKTPEADLIIYASFLHAKSSGALPYLLGKELNLLDN